MLAMLNSFTVYHPMKSAAGYNHLFWIYTETGKTVSRAISSLQEHGVKVEKIILVTLFATPQGEYLKFTIR